MTLVGPRIVNDVSYVLLCRSAVGIVIVIVIVLCSTE